MLTHNYSYEEVRWTFLVSGLQHPSFVRIVAQLTTGGQDKLAAAARALAA